MPLEQNIATSPTLDPSSQALLDSIRDVADRTALDGSVYFDYPLYRDDDGNGVIRSKVLLLTRTHGLLIFGTSAATRPTDVNQLLSEDASLEQVYSHVFARMLKNRRLRRGKQDLIFALNAAIFAPALRMTALTWPSETKLLATDSDLDSFLSELAGPPLSDEALAEIQSTLEGAKGLMKPKPRNIPGLNPASRGSQAQALESEICNFDRQQKEGYLTSFDGPQRIRGLAGSGKTIVLAMKAALTHLRYPDAKILYTFHTKSLYQHVRRLITRFYRQYDDHDPDWDRLHVMHSWGGANWPGVYYVACKSLDVPPLTYADASRRSRDKPFEAACLDLMGRGTLTPIYDYVLIDEGQDFTAPFIQLCRQLCREDKFVLAYDELQTIWQSRVPTAAEIFGVNADGTALLEFERDTVLRKCYRNPLEALVCAHAIGFGIYGHRIVQMLENREHWEDIGYHVVEGDFVTGSATVVERPRENSLTSISNASPVDDIVKVHVASDFNEEVRWIIESIRSDLSDGLRADDIMIITVDDRNAKTDLTVVGSMLCKHGIRFNNIHMAGFGEYEFSQDEHVTLTTVHKAKGNEAFAAYVMSVQALYPRPTVRERNMLFTAMTRAKGWLRVVGSGAQAAECRTEIEQAKSHLPRLSFIYPSEEHLKIMQRELVDSQSRRMRAEHMLDEVMAELTPEEIEARLTRVKRSTGSGSRRKRR